MSSENKSLGAVAAAGVVVALGLSLVAGIRTRNAVDLGGLKVAESNLKAPLYASRSLQEEVDDIPEADYYQQMVSLMKQWYVDEITDDHKLVNGSIRGMIGSLEDPHCLYYDATDFRHFQDTRKGIYQGIGVDLTLQMPGQEGKPKDPNSFPIPRIVVSAVVPGGPADKAGLKDGDIIDTVDGHWVIDAEEFDALRELSRQVVNGKASADELNKLREELRNKSKTSIMPMKAKMKLIDGDSGKVDLKVVRGGKTIDVTIEKGPSTFNSVEKNGDAIHLNFYLGAAAKLKEALPADGPVTLDLRNSPNGEMPAMKEVLSVLEPAGTYGAVSSKSASHDIVIGTGAKESRKLNLIVDSSTTGVAEIFANVLRDKGLATVEGKTGGDPTVVEVVQMPDGTGFSLATGVYHKVNEVKKS